MAPHIRRFIPHRWQFGEKIDAVLSNLELLMELHLNASAEEVWSMYLLLWTASKD